MNYIKKERIESRTKYYRYRYLVECPICKQHRWITNYNKNSSLRCKVCAGRQSYTPSKVSRHDKRERGQGYITKQGYHLIYDGEKYIPAHRFAFPELPSNIVIHHIDGNKLNNSLENLIPLSKKDHRYAHGSLEKVSYLLIQSAHSRTSRFSDCCKKHIRLSVQFYLCHSVVFLPERIFLIFLK